MAQKEATGANIMQDTTVIDVDVHLSIRNPELMSRVADRMEEPWASYMDPKSGYASAYPDAGWPKDLGGRKNVEHIQVTDPQEDIQEALCEQFGVDYPIINTIAQPNAVTQTERGIQEARAANDVLIEDFLEGFDHFSGLCSLAVRDPDAAVEEIHRVGDNDQIVGVYLMCGQEYQKPLGDPDYDEMYDAMVQYDLTPVYHVSEFDRNSIALRKLEKWHAAHNLGPAWSAELELTSLITQGVPEKFPELDFVFEEAGISWVPHMMGRLNREHDQWREEAPLLTQSPEEYIRDSFYFATQPLEEFNNNAHMQQIMEIVGADSIMFSSDHPHHDFDNPEALDKFLSGLSPEDRSKILYENASSVFDIDK